MPNRLIIESFGKNLVLEYLGYLLSKKMRVTDRLYINYVYVLLFSFSYFYKKYRLQIKQ